MGICKLSENGYWAVDGKPIYTPTTFKVNGKNLVSSDSKRVESGKYYIRWIRGLREIEISYSLITAQEVAELHELLVGKEYDFTFYDNEIHTARAFAREDKYSLHRLDVYPEYGGLYKNYTVKIEFV